MQNQKQSGLGIAGMVLGIIAILLSCLVVGGFIGIVGLILSIVGVLQKEKGKGTAIAGIVCNSISILIMIIIFALPFSTNKNSNDQSQNDTLNPQPITEAFDPLSDDIIDVDISDCHVKYIKHEIVENMSGDKCVAVYYEFTNNSKEGKTFDFTISDKAFQNGIELDISLFHVNDESKNGSSEIKPGVTITVCSGFVLRDETSDVELEVDEWISFNKSIEDKMVLSLK